MVVEVERRMLDREFLQVIGGERHPARSGATFQTLDPATGIPLASVPRGGAADVDAAVEAAYRAFRSATWAKLKPYERGRLLSAYAAGLRAVEDGAAVLESLDTGKPYSQALADVRGSVRYLEYYAGVADKIEGTHTPLGPGSFAVGTREPYGVVGIIVPWNSPINQATRSLAPALAAGNVAVIKPAENTPLTAILLAEIALEAGFPPGVVNVVTGFGAEAGQPLAQDERVRRISFTGSVETGRRIAEIAAQRLVPSSLELGGKSACIVFDDADLEAVVSTMVRTVTVNTGQVCSAATRMVVARNRYDELIARCGDAFEDLSVGRGVDDPALGPLVSSVQLDRVLSYLDVGRNEGAEVLLGGGRYDRDDLSAGYFVRPTVLGGVAADMVVAQEEIFGPVISVLTYEDEAEAVAIANGTNYGLAAGVYTADIDRALRVSGRLEAGQVFVNGYQAGGVETAFGGYKQSGWGREKGLAALDDYTQLKTTIFTFRD